MVSQVREKSAQRDNVTGKFRQRLRRLEAIVEAICRDEKPYLDTNDSFDASIYKSLTRMHAGLLISEDPETFITLPGEGAEEINKKGVLRVHPLHYALVEEEEHIHDMLASHNIRNAKVLGTDPAFRFHGVNPLKLYECADSFILPRSDYVALREFVHLLRAKIDGDEENARLIEDKVLTLRNSSGFWDPLIQGLGLDDKDNAQWARKHANLHITTSVHDIDAILIRELNGDIDRKPKSPHNTLRIQPGDHDLMISGNMKKLHEWPEIYQLLKAQVDVRSFNNIVGLPEEAPEESHSYSGNCIEKLDKAAELIDAIGYEHVCEILRDHGIDPERAVIRAEDRGMISLDDLFADPVFNDVRRHMNPYKIQPGAELAHVLEGMNTPDMYARLKIAAQRKSENLYAAGAYREVDLRVHDYANTSLIPLLPDENGARPVYSFSGATRDTLTFEPKPAEDPVYYSEHYLIPEHELGRNGRTKAQIPNYIPEQSSMAEACRAMVHTTGMDEHRHKLNTTFDHAAGSRKMRIATQHSIMPWADGHDYKALQRSFTPDTNAAYGHLQFGFVNGIEGEYDITKPRNHTVPVKGDGTRTFYSALNNMHLLMREADGFLLTPEITPKRDQDYIWSRLYFALSATVAKQTFDRTAANKLFASHEPVDDGYESEFNSLVLNLHRKGLIGEKPRHIFKAPPTREKLVKTFREASASYVPPHIPAYEYEESGVAAPEDMDRITVYCSAKFNNEEMDALARYIGYEAAASGFALKNGGGKGGLMLQTSLGFHEFRNNDHDDPRQHYVTQTHITSVQCAETRQMEGLCDFNDLIKVYPSIHLRIEDLADAETEIVLPGGAGTWQEIAGSAILRRAGLKDPANRPLIIVDPEIGHGKHRTRPYQKIIDMIPGSDFHDLNIHVVGTGEQAMKLAMQARDDRRRAMTYERRAANSNDRGRDCNAFPRPA